MNDRCPVGAGLLSGGIVVVSVLCLVAVGGAAGATTGTACGAGSPHGNATGTPSVAVDMFVAQNDTFDELATVDGIRAAMADGRVRPARSERDIDDYEVTEGRIRIFRLRFTGETARVLHGVDGRSEQEIDQAADRLLTEHENVSFQVRFGTCAPRANLSASHDAGAIEYVVDTRNRSIYAVVDPKRAVYEYPGQRHRGGIVRLTVGNGPDAVEDSFWYYVNGREAEFDGEEPLHLNGTDNATLSGRTGAFPGTTLTVALNVSGESTPRRRTVTVGPDWRFEATFDLSSVPANTRVVASVPGYEYSREIGVVGPSPAFVGTIRTHTDHEAVFVDTLDFPRSGHLVVREYNASDPLGGQILGHTRVDSDDSEASIPVSKLDFTTQRLVVVAVRDEGNESYDPEIDRPFRVNGEPVTKVARVENENVEQTRVTPTPTASTEAGPTGSSTPESTLSGTARTAPKTTDRTGPGFGAGLAVLAVVAATLVGRRLTRR